MVIKDGICDKSSAPSVSSISRLLRGSRGGEGSDDCGSSIDGNIVDPHRPQHDHTINGILAGTKHQYLSPTIHHWNFREQLGFIGYN